MHFKKCITAIFPKYLTDHLMDGEDAHIMNRNKIIGGCVVVGLIGLFIFIFTPKNKDENELPIVAITQIATHPALDEVREGIITGLEKRGYKDGENIKIIFRNANGDASLTLPIAQDFVRRSPAVIVPISTPSTLAVQKSTKRIPIIFSGVADPKGSGIVSNFEHPGGNITGVCDRWPFEKQVKTFLDVFPDTKKIGMLYTQGDDVSRIGVESMKKIKDSLGFELILVPISSPQDIYTSAVALLQRVDTIFTGIDHMVLENMDGLAKAAKEAKKPLFGGEPGSVKKGAVIAYSIDMTEFGDTTADMIVEVLKGRNPKEMPVRVVSNGKILVNRSAANRFKLDISALKKKGVEFIEESSK